MSDENRVMSYGNNKSKQPLNLTYDRLLVLVLALCIRVKLFCFSSKVEGGGGEETFGAMYHLLLIVHMN